MVTKKRVKRRLNIKGVLFILLVLYLIGMFFYTLFTTPIKNIYIKGTNLIKDNEVIEIAGIKNYPSIFKISKKSLEKKVKGLELVEDVTIDKKLNGKLYINITEGKPIYYNRATDRVVLSSGKEVNNSEKYMGLPSLIHTPTSEILARFNEAFGKVETDIIKMINEIEYDPDITEDIMIDEDRFLLRMNDGNIVYVNILNMERLNNYEKIYASLTKKGTLFLDNYETGNVYGLFIPFGGNS